MSSTVRSFFMRLSACAALSALVLTLSADLGQVRARQAQAESVAAAAGQAAVGHLDRRKSLDQQRRQVEEVVHAVLTQAGEDLTHWQLSLMLTGTGPTPIISAVVSTDQPVPTRLLGLLSAPAATLHAEATASAVALPQTPPPRVIAAGEPSSTVEMD